MQLMPFLLHFKTSQERKKKKYQKLTNMLYTEKVKRHILGYSGWTYPELLLYNSKAYF